MKILNLLIEDLNNSSKNEYYDIVKILEKPNDPDSEAYYLNIGNLDKMQKLQLIKLKFILNKDIKDSVFFKRTKRQLEYFLKNELPKLRDSVNKIIPNLLPPENELANEFINSKPIMPTAQQIAQANENLNVLFEKLFNFYEKPEYKELLGRIGTIGIDQKLTEKAFHVFSPKNLLLAYAQDPNVTFLATTAGWKKYNRAVRGDAKPIILKGTSGTVKDDEYGELSTGLKKSAAKKLGQQGEHSFDVYSSTNPYRYPYYLYYDVADTVVIAGKKDKWSLEPGLTNNLTRELNRYATELIMKEKGMDLNDNPVDFKNIYDNKDKNEFVMKNIVTQQKFQDLIGKSNIDSLKKRDFSDDKTVFDALYLIFSSIFERTHDNILKNQQIYTGINFIYLMEDFGGESIKTTIPHAKELINQKIPNREQILNIFNKALAVRNGISFIKLNESDENPLIDDLLNKMGYSLSDFPENKSDMDRINETIKIILQNKNIL